MSEMLCVSDAGVRDLSKMGADVALCPPGDDSFGQCAKMQLHSVFPNSPIFHLFICFELMCH